MYLSKPLLLQIQQPLFPDVLLHVAVADASSRLPFLLTASLCLLPGSLTPSAPGSMPPLLVVVSLLLLLLCLSGPPPVPPYPRVLCSPSLLFFFCVFRLFCFFLRASPARSFPPVCLLMILRYSVGLSSPAAVVPLFCGSELSVVQGNIELAICISCLLTLATCNAEVVV